MRRKVAIFFLDSVAVGLVVGFLLWFFVPGMQGNAQYIEQSQQGVTGPSSYSKAVEAAAPAVVSIKSSRHSLSEADPTNIGSGVLIDTLGHILTNDHVVRDADEIQVTLRDRRITKAKLVGRDPETDLAVLSIDLEDLPTIRWSDSRAVRIGDVVLAIGNPFGIGQTVTMGIVSGTGRHELGLNTFENFIQTDAAINPGSSGGALINSEGELIGINSAIFNRSGGYEGIGFAIPSELARGLLKQIIEQGKVVRGWLGIVIQDLTPQLAESFHLPPRKGVIVAGVVSPGPAADAGLEVGDIILDIDGKAVESSRTILNQISSHAPGFEIGLLIVRDQKKKKIIAKVSERPLLEQNGQ